jgi:DNA polymerase-1
MIQIGRDFRERGLKARMILQVHDELLFELPMREHETVRDIVREKMERAVELSVPIQVDIGHGKNWAEAH